jgi:hypothetical protein
MGGWVHPLPLLSIIEFQVCNRRASMATSEIDGDAGMYDACSAHFPCSLLVMFVVLRLSFGSLLLLASFLPPSHFRSGPSLLFIEDPAISDCLLVLLLKWMCCPHCSCRRKKRSSHRPNKNEGRVHPVTSIQTSWVSHGVVSQWQLNARVEQLCVDVLRLYVCVCVLRLDRLRPCSLVFAQCDWLPSGEPSDRRRVETYS